MDLYSADSWVLQKADQKFLELSEVLYWRRLEKISRTDRVTKYCEEVGREQT
jgi:hypothetical protein